MRKFLQIMSSRIRGSIFLFMMFFLAASAAVGQTKTHQINDSVDYLSVFEPENSSQHTEIKVSLDFKNLMLSKALLKLAKEANIGLSFDRELIPSKQISYNCHKKKLYSVLHDFLNDTDLTFNISKDRETVIIQKKTPKADLSTITGTVTDAKTGEPMVGVNILVKGTSHGAITDADGDYHVNVPSLQDTLLFSYIGYQTKKIPINGRATIDIELHPTVLTAGNQLVVIGYGKQKKKDLTGAISSVSSQQIEDIPVTNVVQTLQGKVAGVQIINGSGKPNSSPSIIIRGASSLHQPNPLYIVDGVRVSADHINTINPQDIKSISVLKDASAAAIYGAGAAGGVIIINTKKGKSGKISVAFNARYGVSQPKVMHLLDKKHYIKLENIIHPAYFKNKNHTDTLANTNWTDALYKRGTTQKYNLAISGGNDVTTYRFSGFYSGKDGAYINNYSKHYGFKVSSSYQIFDFLKVGEHLDVSQRSWRPTPPGETNLSYHNPPFRTLPIIPIGNKKGWGTLPAGYSPLQFSGPNLVGGVKTAHPKNLDNNVRGVIHATLDIPKNLTLKVHLSYARYHSSNDYFQEPYYFSSGANLGHNFLNKTSVANSQLLDNIVLSYDKDLFEKHHIHAMVGFEQIKRTYNRVHAKETSIGLPGRSFVRTSNTETSASGKYDPNYLVKSEFGRVTYNYEHRYYVSGSLRQDANFTAFGPNNKRGVFGAVSGAWNISNERFFKPLLPIINELKLRGSYGSIGNSNIGSYNYLSTYHILYGAGGSAIAGQNYAPGAPLIIGNTVSAIPNPSLHWERDYEINAGINGELFSGKLIFSVDWYKRTTKGMLYALPMALSSGYSDSFLTNIGKVTSKGIEFSVGVNNHTHDFQYNVRFTGSFNHNVVNNLGGVTNSSIKDGFNYYDLKNNTYGIMQGQKLTITKAGQPFGSFYGYKVLGLFPTQKAVDSYKHNRNKIQPDARAGDLKYADTNGDGTINAADKQIIGNPNPKFTYGLNINLHWKDLELTMNWNGVAGVDIFNGVKAYAQSVFSDGNTTSQVFNDSFFAGNKLTDQPRLGVKNKDGSFTLDPNGNYKKVSSYFVEDGSYLKLKTIQLGYNFSSTLLENLGINRAKIYVVAYNLLTITGYSGLDPELGSAYSAAAQSGAVSNNAITVTTRGIDMVPLYPHIKTYSVGFDFKF